MVVDNTPEGNGGRSRRGSHFELTHTLAFHLEEEHSLPVKVAPYVSPHSALIRRTCEEPEPAFAVSAISNWKVVLDLSLFIFSFDFVPASALVLAEM